MKNLWLFDDDIYVAWKLLEIKFQSEYENKLYYCSLTGQNMEYIMKQPSRVFDDIVKSFLKASEVKHGRA